MNANLTPDTYWDLFTGYTALWVILAVFIMRMILVQSRLAKRCEDLENQIRLRDEGSNEPKRLKSNM